jgi:uncharacterized protein YggE
LNAQLAPLPLGRVPKESFDMSRSPFRSRSRAVLALVTLAGLAGATAHAQDTPSILVVGTGDVAAVPDTGHLSAGVVSEAESAGEAVRANSVAMQRVLDALDAAGIAKRDVRTDRFQVHPVYADEMMASRGRPRITGYRVSNQVSVRVRDLEKVGSVLDELIGAGANEMGGISFSVGEPAPLLDEARKRAVADARRKAELYAASAGVRLGRLLELAEDGGGGPGPMPRMARMSADESVPIAAGELELSVTVRARYAIEP